MCSVKLFTLTLTHFVKQKKTKSEIIKMLKHANFDKIDHLKGHINSSFQCDNRIGTFINLTTWDKRLIKTKKVPCV
jgi:hypothetical protein